MDAGTEVERACEIAARLTATAHTLLTPANLAGDLQGLPPRPVPGVESNGEIKAMTRPRDGKKRVLFRTMLE